MTNIVFTKSLTHPEGTVLFTRVSDIVYAHIPQTFITSDVDVPLWMAMRVLRASLPDPNFWKIRRWRMNNE